MTSALPSPLGGPPPSEVPLANAPLERVIAQVQFAPISKIEERNFVSAFQEEMRVTYPFFLEEREQFLQVEIVPGSQSVLPKTRPVWRFLDAGRNWRISLNSEAVSLEVKNYSSRTDFLRRWKEILVAMAAHFRPALVVRVGMRYINRIRGDNVNIISTLIKPAFLGPLVVEVQNHVVHSISETSLAVEEGNLLLRLGKLPKNGTVDPNLLEPINSESFIIDIDVSSSNQIGFNAKELDEVFHKFAEREYSMFRNVVTNDFIQTYGGQL